MAESILEQVDDIFRSCYRADVQEVILNRWSISPHTIRTMEDMKQLLSLSSEDDRRWFIAACSDLRRKKRRRVNDPVGAERRPQDTPLLLADGRSAELVFQPFNNRELHDIVHSFISLTSRSRASKRGMLEAVCNVPANLQILILGAAERVMHERVSTESTTRERNRSSNTPAPDIVNPNLEPHNETEYRWQETEYLKAPAQDIIRQRIRDFRERTGNASLAMTACVVCAREVFVRETQQILVSDIPNAPRLSPATPHPRHSLTGPMLLYPRTYGEHEEVYVCHDCLTALEKDRTPRLSLANNMWIGEVPRELRGLTLPERLLIGLYIPVAHVVKLYPKKVGASNWDRSMLYDGLRGNVSSFPLDQRSIADMLTAVKPAPLDLLTATIGITFVGPRNTPSSWLHGRLPSNFTVRRAKVARALHWLVTNNPLYASIQISEERLASLPENAIPDQLYGITRISDDTAGLHQESMNYVPGSHDDFGDDSPPDESPETFVDEFPEGPVEDFQTPEPEDFVDWADPLDLEESPPDVIPIVPLGVIDANGENIPERELVAHAFANAASGPALPMDKYLVRHGSAFVNEYARKDPSTGERYDGGPDNPNHLLGAFPTLFPYGCGGFETWRPLDVSYEQHSAWALQYADKRFRRDTHFIFQIFGVRQKREVCRSATLQIDKQGLQRHSHLLALLKPSDLLKASQEETARVRHSNPAVRALREHLTAIRRRVPGTDESRFIVRSKVWGTNLVFNTPAFWITINPSDTQCPIAQCFVGADIDLDNFSKTAGPDTAERKRNISGDPYASAKYFHFIIHTMLETLFGIEVSKSHPPKRRQGIFGTIQAYIGTVEAQGRGTLHLHMLVWLKDSPTPSQLKAMLESEEFRFRVKTFIDQCIHADLDSKDDSEVKAMPVDKEASYSRPVDPDLPEEEYLSQQQAHVGNLARSLQYHECGPIRCLKKIRGVFQCKRRAPWPTSTETWVATTGQYGPRRLAAFFNAWNPVLMDTLRCNHDFQLLLGIAVVSRIIWYITNYATKKQQRSTNVTAVLANRLAFHNALEANRADQGKRNKRLLERCANALTKDREFSGPEVVSYIMGWGDRYESHVYAPIFWDPVEQALKATFPHIMLSMDSDNDNESEHRTAVTYSSGSVELQDQLRDYRYRGAALEKYSFYDFVIGTYEEKRPKTTSGNHGDDGDNGGIAEDPTPQETSAPRRAGRPSNTRVPYLEEAKKDKTWRVVRTRGHETLPRIVGRWPCPNDETQRRPLYCASMLALFKPWRHLETIHHPHESFEAAFQHMYSNCPSRNKIAMENIQYYHQSARDAKEDLSSTTLMGASYTDPDVDVSASTTITDEDRERERHALAVFLDGVTESHLCAAERASVNDREVKYAEDAVASAKSVGLLEPTSSHPPDLSTAIGEAHRASTTEMSSLGEWKTMLETATRDGNAVDVGEVTDLGGVADAVHLSHIVQTPSVQMQLGSSTTNDLLHMLNREQRRAHDIIVTHLNNHLNHPSGIPQHQLLMQVQGEGGTGKSLLIAAITKSFKAAGASTLLAKCATTGISAVPIEGMTVHSWASLPLKIPATGNWITKAKASQEEERNRRVGTKTYLIVDEVSMMTKAVLQALNRVATHARSKMDMGEPGLPFGGMNVILFGDFHQFPPVSNSSGALYCDRPLTDSEDAKLGRQLFKKFNTVVILRQQNRSSDQRWNQLLSRLREGLCSDEDVDILRSLVITNPYCDLPLWDDPQWFEHILVTPRHTVRQRWNQEAIKRYARRTGKIVFVILADDIDMQSGLPASGAVKLAMAQRKDNQTTRADQQRMALERRLEIFEGMKAMVLLNIATEADVANGTRGTIERILLDPREGEVIVDDSGYCTLRYLPVAIWLRPIKPCSLLFPGVPEGLIPLVPAQSRISGMTSTKQKFTVRRRQFCITPAYAFTDYKSQAQTIEKVIVDIAKPPSGALSPFNVYVALSRSRGREHIRLLRDFDESLMTMHPSEDLRLEMHRLRALDACTEQQWNFVATGR